MKLLPPAKHILKLLVLLLSFYSLAPIQTLAVPYGSCAYGSDSRMENCLESDNFSPSIISQPPSPSFLDKYEWILFGALILLSMTLFILLVLARRHKSGDISNQPPPSTTAQP